MTEGPASGRDVVAQRLAYLSIYVSDIRESRAFYADLLGLAVVSDEDWGVVLDAGEVQLFLHPGDSDRPPQRLEMTFDVSDVDQSIADLEVAGVRMVDDATDRDWGERDGAVSDPDGNVVYLRSDRRK
jgi:catechol 2,3-dioxygenase-like lactoylglutathione lyase family enzyme